MARWLEIAWSQVGTAEVAGKDANPRIVEYFRTAGFPDVTSDEVAWCGAAVAYCLSKGGVALDAVPQDLRLRARAYLKIGGEISEPRVGAVVVLSRHVAGDPGAGHVGFVAGYSETQIMVLGGNQSNAFNVTPFPRSSVIGYRWPEVVTPADLDARGSRITTTANAVQNDGYKGGVLETASHAFPTDIPPAVGKLAKSATDAIGLYEQFAVFAVFVWSKAPILLGVAGLFFIVRMIWNSEYIRLWRAEDASTGAHQGRPADAAEQ